ncbi:MAG: hypothetical protein KKA58_01200 [Nanoarchaeota archaeon]|nr:hypothetical protein [Nanoarchaeota archaeon]MBU1875709.1 hypothetical protein [Nanoarchaeota archaeon]
MNQKFRIEREDLEDRLKINLKEDISHFKTVIPLRDIRIIEHMAFVRTEILEALIKSIPLRREEELIFPYSNSQIQIYGVEPKGIDVGQTFVQSSKVLSIMKNMTAAFEAYATKGISKMPPAQIYGRDTQDNPVMAFYIPPIIEHHNGGGVLLDGMHRSYICSSAGTTVNAIHIKNIGNALPFSPITWKKVSLVDEKPPIDERYKNLQKNLFRDLSYVGIDG